MADPKDAGNLPADDGSAKPEGNQVADWRAGLDPVLAKDPSLAAIKDIPSLAKGYVEGQKFVGGSIRLPNDKMKPEEQEKAWGDIFGKLGRPADADKYEIKVAKEVERFLPESDVKAFKAAAYKAGLSGKQAQAMIDHYQGVVGANSAQLVEMRKSTEASLREEWGPAFDRNVGLAARAVIESGGKDLLKFLDDTGLGNHPALIKAFAKVGNILSSEGYMEGDIEGSSGPSEAKDRIESILGDKSHPYWDAQNPGHKNALAEMSGLYKVAYPEA